MIQFDQIAKINCKVLAQISKHLNRQYIELFFNRFDLFTYFYKLISLINSIYKNLKILFLKISFDIVILNSIIKDKEIENI